MDPKCSPVRSSQWREAVELLNCSDKSRGEGSVGHIWQGKIIIINNNINNCNKLALWCTLAALLSSLRWTVKIMKIRSMMLFPEVGVAAWCGAVISWCYHSCLSHTQDHCYSVVPCLHLLTAQCHCYCCCCCCRHEPTNTPHHYLTYTPYNGNYSWCFSLLNKYY